MRLLRPFKSLLLFLLRLLKKKTAEDLHAATGITDKKIGRMERGEVKPASPDLARLFAAMGASNAEVVILSACLEARGELDPCVDAAEAAAQELFVAAMSRRLRRRLRAPGSVEAGEYPAPYDVDTDRAEARSAWDRLRELKTRRELVLLVRVAPEYQGWAFLELLCAESACAAAKDAGRALDLAFTAVRIAARHLRGRDGWRRRLLGFAGAHLANALRVAGDLVRADRTLAAAKRLWAAGEDPDLLLDPGRLLDLEASLRRDQRRFEESLDLLERATAVSRRPEHLRLNMAFTLEVMGEHRRALEILTEVAPRIEHHPEARLRTIHLFNFAVALSHAGRHREAAKLLPSIRRMVKRDELDRIRAKWLAGRIFAGLGRTEAALKALAESRRCFARRGMHYDVALSLLETAALLLERGELAEVQRPTDELAPIFEENGVHDEAVKALRLFEEAVARQTATAELARYLLAWLFRAVYDRGLVFSPAPAAGNP